MSIVVYKASAGSGKTYTIVLEYIVLLLDAYPQGVNDRLRSILAITFTNKAAAEMKERVLRALRRLASGDCTLYPNLWTTYPDLQERAKGILKVILHHYGDFTITTIDSFIQRVARGVAFELDLPFQFQVLLNKRTLFEEIVGEILEDYGNSEMITNLFDKFIEYALESSISLNVEDVFLRRAESIYAESAYFYLASVIREKAFAYGGSFYKHIVSTQLSIKKERKAKAQQILDEMKKQGIVKDDIFNKGKGNVNYVEKIASGEALKSGGQDEDGKYIFQWVSSKIPNPSVEHFYQTVVERLLTDIHAPNFLKNPNSPVTLGTLFYTYEAIVRYLYFIALMNLFEAKLQQKIRMLQMIPIEEFTRRLHEKLKKDYVPYLYMRIGEKYSYFFIDEFQDTSRLQWENLFPLIENALGSGGKAYLVGDPKQAIYRWRNGDVRIMLRDVPNIGNSSHNVTEKNLAVNYRSRKVIVDFVNALFSQIKNMNQHELLKKSYEGLWQKSKSEGGYVEVECVLSCLGEEPEGNWCKSKIDEVKQKGYAFRDIAVLVRDNKMAIKLADYLVEKGIPVVSENSLLLVQSPVVQLMVAALGVLLRPTERMAIFSLVVAYADVFALKEKYRALEELLMHWPSENEKMNIQDALNKWQYGESFSQCKELFSRRLDFLSLSLYDLTEELVRLFGLHTKKEAFAYLSKFLDVVHSFSIREGGSIADFLDFWEREGKNLALDPDETADAVRILTIHKAKGLEFPVVIIPALFSSSHAGKNKDIVAPLPSLDGEYGSALPPREEKWYWIYKKSANLAYVPEVAESDQEEDTLSRLDEMNVMYVALTRPRDALFVFVPWESKQEDERWTSETVAHLAEKVKGGDTLLDAFLSFCFAAVREDFLNQNWKEKTLRFWQGEMEEAQKREDASFSAILEEFPSSSWQDKLRVHRHTAEIHLLFHEKRQKGVQTGIILHELLAGIRKAEDIERVSNQYRNRLPGDVSEEGMEEIKTMLQAVWDIFVSRSWVENFDVYNEENILTPRGLIRPDKVFLERNKKKAIVVDYKSGEQAHEVDQDTVVKRYRNQLLSYCQALQAMGYERVEGYVLMIDTQKLFEVVVL